MGDIHYVRDCPEGTILFNSTGVLVRQSTFDRLGDYTRSMPTGPSPGRIWRRANFFTALMPSHEHFGMDPNWFVYVAQLCPGVFDPKDLRHKRNHEDGKCIEMFGRKALIVP